MKKKLTAILACILLFSMFLTACSGSEPAENSNSPAVDDNPSGSQVVPEAKTELVCSLFEAAKTLDPVSAYGSNEWNLLLNVYEPLIRWNENNVNDLQPGMAESWEADESGKVYTFHLRQGVKFHNGDVMTADDVVFTLERDRESNNLAGYLFMIDTVEKVDDSTVKITLNQIYPDFLKLLGRPDLGIVCKAAVEQYGADSQGMVVGTGAYKLDKWDISGEMVFVANEDFYMGAPSIKTVRLKVLADQTTQQIALESGDIDFYMANSATVCEWAEQTEGYTYTGLHRDAVNTLHINAAANEILGNKDVRKAIAYAIDRESLCVAASANLTSPVQMMMHNSNFAGYTTDMELYEYNVDKARELLASAGYADGFRVKLMYSTAQASYEKACVAIQSMLAQVGIQVELEPLQPTAATDRLRNRSYELCYYYMGVTSYDSFSLYNNIVGDRGRFNYVASMPISGAQELLEQISSCTTAEAREPLYTELNKLIQDAAYDLPCENLMSPYCHKSDLKGIEKALCDTANGLEWQYLYWEN